jgi:hypothetical protein
LQKKPRALINPRLIRPVLPCIEMA